MQSHQLINQTCGDVEYFTDPKIIEAARSVLGTIDLDPASCEAANRIVKAKEFFTWKDDGMLKPWRGNIWLNHPFGRAEKACTSTCTKALDNPKHVHHSYEFYGNYWWIKKLIEECCCGNIEQALNITFAATSEVWFQPLAFYPQCFLAPRTNYYLPDGTLKRGVSKGSVVTYLGPDVDKFAAEFKSFGTIKVKFTHRLNENPL